MDVRYFSYVFVSLSVIFSIVLCFSKYRSFTSLLFFRLVIATYIYGYICVCVCFSLLISLFQVHFNNPDLYFPFSVITILVNIYITSLFYGSLLLLLSRFSHVRPCVTPQTAAHQASLSLGFSRQKHWSGLPCPSPMRESER